jgi:transposase InsO family protein
MEVSASAFYAWLKTPADTDKTQQKAALEAKARQLFDDHKHTYGYRRLSDALGKAGLKSGHYQVRHLMARLGLKARYPKRFKVTTDSNHDEAISPNSLDRQFDVVAPNQVWTTDITYVWTLDGWLYLAVVIDLFSRQVVGWSMAEPMRTSLCVSALQMAFWRRKPEPGLLHHSDRGSQYASHEYREHLSIMKMEQSMSRKGNCWDNYPVFIIEERGFEYGGINFVRAKLKSLVPHEDEDYVHMNVYAVCEDFAPAEPGIDYMGSLLHWHITDSTLLLPRSQVFDEMLVKIANDP